MKRYNGYALTNTAKVNFELEFRYEAWYETETCGGADYYFFPDDGIVIIDYHNAIEALSKDEFIDRAEALYLQIIEM